MFQCMKGSSLKVANKSKRTHQSTVHKPLSNKQHLGGLFSSNKDGNKIENFTNLVQKRDDSENSDNRTSLCWSSDY